MNRRAYALLWLPGDCKPAASRVLTLLVTAGLAGWGLTAEGASPQAATAEVQAEPASQPASDSEKRTGGVPGEKWVRLLKDDDGEVVAMQTAVVRYEGVPAGGDKPVVVDLVGAVHVGDLRYYEELNELFEDYDALLYELVAPEGTVIEQGVRASSRHPVGALQNGMKTMLELEHQLEQVNYTASNFVHADMSPQQLFAKMDERGEGMVQLYFRMMGQGIAMQSKQTADGESADLDILLALFAKDRARQLKMAMAKQMINMEGLLLAFGGEEGSTLITERNKIALEVLKRELEAGKRKVGVFYGAGHLADMDERLREDFGLKPVKVTWLTAWNLD